MEQKIEEKVVKERMIDMMLEKKENLKLIGRVLREIMKKKEQDERKKK